MFWNVLYSEFLSNIKKNQEEELFLVSNLVHTNPIFLNMKLKFILYFCLKYLKLNYIQQIFLRNEKILKNITK